MLFFSPPVKTGSVKKPVDSPPRAVFLSGAMHARNRKQDNRVKVAIAARPLRALNLSGMLLLGASFALLILVYGAGSG